ncbi:MULTISPECIES: superoxide dismutase family protein [unclassified Streptomyces]|uniref:superoxide dismutase family protein n=1 Tax=unclassified Streptomyces TaxID=2593676 RepID=UPI001F035F3A|nr:MULTISPECIES: superoxide dismutase family protein [unclassified Streptomyces]
MDQYTAGRASEQDGVPTTQRTTQPVVPPAIRPVTRRATSERHPRARRARNRLVAGGTAAAATALLLSGCGGGSSADTSDKAAAASAAPSKGMDGMSDMAMGDPQATPADRIPGADVVKGSFTLLDTRPPGMDDVKGTAWLAQGPKGTTVTVSLTGLKPGHHYMAHLHARHCNADNGGPHFQFTKGGPTAPPNEVHLVFDADASGKAMTTVGNDKKTGEGAVAVVVHPMEAMDNRIACADFGF